LEQTENGAACAAVLWMFNTPVTAHGTHTEYDNTHQFAI